MLERFRRTLSSDMFCSFRRRRPKYRYPGNPFSTVTDVIRSILSPVGGNIKSLRRQELQWRAFTYTHPIGCRSREVIASRVHNTHGHDDNDRYNILNDI